MSKKNLNIMNDVIGTYREILAREMRGPSDTESAMHRIQTKYGIDYWQQWGLRFRPPKRVTAELIERVRQAYLSALQSSVKKDIQRLQIEAAKGDTDAALESLLAESEMLLAKIAKKLNG